MDDYSLLNPYTSLNITFTQKAGHYCYCDFGDDMLMTGYVIDTVAMQTTNINGMKIHITAGMFHAEIVVIVIK